MLCKNCGQELEDGKQFCPNCGAPVAAEPQPAAPAAPAVERYKNGGLIAWSILSLLLCLIGGIVALVQACGINNCTTVEAQKKKISSAKTWCIISTIWGALTLIASIAAQPYIEQAIASMM